MLFLAVFAILCTGHVDHLYFEVVKNDRYIFQFATRIHFLNPYRPLIDVKDEIHNEARERRFVKFCTLNK